MATKAQTKQFKFQGKEDLEGLLTIDFNPDKLKEILAHIFSQLEQVAEDAADAAEGSQMARDSAQAASEAVMKLRQDVQETKISVDTSKHELEIEIMNVKEPIKEMNEQVKEHGDSIIELSKGQINMSDLDKKFARITSLESLRKDHEVTKMNAEMAGGQINDLYYKEELQQAENVKIKQELEKLSQRIAVLEDVKDQTVDPIEMTRLLNGMLEEVKILRNLKNDVDNLKISTIDPFLSRVQNIEKCILKQEKHFDVVDKQIAGIEEKFTTEVENNLANRVLFLEQQFQNTCIQIQQLNENAESKADKSDLEALQELFNQRLEEQLLITDEKYAHQSETRKTFKLFERQIKNLYDLWMSKFSEGGTFSNDEQAMLSKKPLTKTSCASCEKDIVNLAGYKADHIAWSKFPFRDIYAEKTLAGKAGHGYSKVLQMVSPESQLKATVSKDVLASRTQANSSTVGELVDNQLSQPGNNSSVHNYQRTQPYIRPLTAGTHRPQQKGLLRPSSAQVNNMPHRGVVRTSSKLQTLSTALIK